MKFLYFIFWLIFSETVLGQASNEGHLFLPAVLISASTFDSSQKYANATQMVSAYFTEEDRTNINVLINVPSPCPPEYTNVISNTNLFSPSERELIKAVPFKFKNVTVNSAPEKTVCVGTNNSYALLSGVFLIRRYQYTNSGDQVEVIFYNAPSSKERAIGVSFRTKLGDGYEELFNQTFRQFKHGRLDGLWVDFDRGHCAAWMRFKDGKAFGKWLVWDRTGSLYMKMEFKEPYDFIGHLKYSS